MGIPERVEQLEADVAKLKDCMCSCHKTLDAVVRCHRLHGEYIEADLCDECHKLLELHAQVKT